MEKPINDCTAFILCGGASRRMGEAKALLDWDGEPLAVHLARRLGGCFERVVCVVKERSMAEALGVECALDPMELRHPAVGWLAALENALTGWALVTGVDMPLINMELIVDVAKAREKMVEDRPIASRDAEGRWRPLPIFLPVSMKESLRRRLESDPNASLQRLCAEFDATAIEEAAWERFDPQKRSLVNLNTPEAFSEALARVRSESTENE